MPPVVGVRTLRVKISAALRRHRPKLREPSSCAWNLPPPGQFLLQPSVAHEALPRIRRFDHSRQPVGSGPVPLQTCTVGDGTSEVAGPAVFRTMELRPFAPIRVESRSERGPTGALFHHTKPDPGESPLLYNDAQSDPRLCLEPLARWLRNHHPSSEGPKASTVHFRRCASDVQVGNRSCSLTRRRKEPGLRLHWLQKSPGRGFFHFDHV